MFWNDIKEIKEGMVALKGSLRQVESSLFQLDERLEAISSQVIPLKTMDQFEDYMKNVDKMNAMVNELKGCVSIARTAVAERKDHTDHTEQLMKDFMRSFENLRGEYHAKMEAVYKAIHATRRRRRRRRSVKSDAV